jgi:hypothetical protein
MSNKKIAESIIQKLGQEGIAHMKATGELPAIKLTNEEMSFLKAGMGPFKKETYEDILAGAAGRPLSDFLIVKKQGQ